MYLSYDFENTVLSSCCHTSDTVDVSNCTFGSMKSRNHKSAFFFAFWPLQNGRIASLNEMELSPRPGVIQYFVKHSIIIESISYSHWFAFCKWFLSVDNETRNMFGKPLEVWHKDLFINSGSSAFIPVQRIFSEAVYADFVHNFNHLRVFVPRRRYSLFSWNMYIYFLFFI